MTARDRIILIVVGAIVVLGAAWLLVVSPEKKRASEVQAKVAAAQTQLSEAQSKLAEAQQAQRRYAQAYASIVSLGQAVPGDREVASLVYELDHASSKDHVSFESIAASGAGGGGSGAAAPSSPGAAAGAASAASAGFQQLPFTFSFAGSWQDLYRLLGRLQGFTVSNPDGSVKVNGRLLSIQGVTLNSAEGGGSGGGASASANKGELHASVTATAYVLPASEGSTGGGSASAPAGASPASGGSGGSAATPAVVRPLR